MTFTFFYSTLKVNGRKELGGPTDIRACVLHTIRQSRDDIVKGFIFDLN